MSPRESPDPGQPDGPANAWALPAADICAALGVDPESGLDPEDVRRRRERYGPNLLRRARRRSAWHVLWAQLASPIVALLGAATAVAFAFGERLEASAIAVVLVVNTAIGFFTESRAVRSMEALRQLARVGSTVRRGGATQVVPAEQLVPGDVVVLDAGDVLTADLRILHASRLQADESALTGESLPVDKSSEEIPSDTALAERSCMLFKGTAVTRGSGEGVVVATGMQTELGRISQLVEEAESEATPLEVRLERLGRRLIALTLGVAALVAAANVASGRDLYFSIEIALALAVAAVPEGLPIVATIALARGMWRMARRNALVEQLSAVETLGSTSVILADKTGTLTENRMQVAELALSDDTTLRIERKPQSERGTAGFFCRDGVAVEASELPLLASALRILALCNNAQLAEGSDRGASGTGDPTELALLAAARLGGFERDALLSAAPELREVAFDAESKRMATLHAEPGGVLAAVKGAPEAVLESCTRQLEADGGLRELASGDRERWLARADEMAGRGQRVLGMATRTLDQPAAFAYEALTFVGLVGLWDPPRAGVREAVEACQAAGIRVVIVTGDHGGTAWQIASATGVVAAEDGASAAWIDARALAQLDRLAPDQERAVLEAPVIARATPKQKLDLIALFQRHGAVVAMTGDGVNDAPALKKADIGVAMGLRGTQVAREAAHMVLQDDEFGTIVAAVAQGRAIFANIRKFVVYLMSCNTSEVLAVAVASLVQGPMPLLPLQILFLNLVTDVFPALALGVGEGSPTLMQAPPRAADEPLIARRHWLRIFALGSAIAAAVLAALLLATVQLGKSGREATTISFLTLALAQLWHVFSMRAPRSSAWNNEITRNAWIWVALSLCLGLLALAVHWAPLASVLSIVPPGTDGWALALGLSLAPLVAGQIGLVLRGRRERASQSR